MKLLCLCSAAFAIALPLAAEQILVSKPEPVDLIELFTSEGCSSCPAAEQRMNRYAQRNNLWTDFVPVAFHVDYWNYLGWTDRFSAPEFSARQRIYAKEWNTSRIYTPCFVVDGKADSKPWKKKTMPNVGVLTLHINDNTVLATFKPAAPTGKPLTAWMALLSGTEVTPVKAGENKGRKLEHTFVALNLIQAPMTAEDHIYSATFKRPEDPSAKAIAAWITEDSSQQPIQATGGWLK